MRWARSESEKLRLLLAYIARLCRRGPWSHNASVRILKGKLIEVCPSLCGTKASSSADGSSTTQPTDSTSHEEDDVVGAVNDVFGILDDNDDDFDDGFKECISTKRPTWF